MPKANTLNPCLAATANASIDPIDYTKGRSLIRPLFYFERHIDSWRLEFCILPYLPASAVEIYSSRFAQSCDVNPCSKPSGINDWPRLRMLLILTREMTSFFPKACAIVIVE